METIRRRSSSPVGSSYKTKLHWDIYWLQIGANLCLKLNSYHSHTPHSTKVSLSSLTSVIQAVPNGHLYLLLLCQPTCIKFCWILSVIWWILMILWVSSVNIGVACRHTRYSNLTRAQKGWGWCVLSSYGIFNRSCEKTQTDNVLVSPLILCDFWVLSAALLLPTEDVTFKTSHEFHSLV